MIWKGGKGSILGARTWKAVSCAKAALSGTVRLRHLSVRVRGAMLDKIPVH